MFNYGNVQTSTRLSPQTSIQLYNPRNNSPNSDSDVDAIVDTGAVMTCIPESTITKLGSSLVYNTCKLRDANGNVQERKTYRIDVKIGDYKYQNLEVIAISKEYALIGRDILNDFVVVLNALHGWGFICGKHNCFATRACSLDL